MRASYVYLSVATATALLASSGSALTAKPMKIAADEDPQESKRLLRSYNMNDLADNDNEERMIRLDSKKIDDLLDTKKIDEILDPKRVDDIFARLKDGKLGGVLTQSKLDSLLSTSPGWSLARLKETFGEMKAAGITAEKFTALMKSDPALEQKYRFVYTAYAGFRKNN